MSMRLKLVLGLIILAVGVWLGVNIGRDQPLFSNPFERKSALQKDFEQGGQELIQDAKKAMRESLK